MQCFSLAWIEQIFVWVVIVCAIIAIINLLLPWLLAKATGAFGTAANIVVAIVRIVFWAFVAIMVIYIAFAFIGCLISMGGGMPSLLPHR
jgi:hydrogenase-4 membrane subunit HyfE